MATITLPHFASFDPDIEPTSVSQRWEKWIQRFTNFLTALNVTDKKRQRALLLHYAGEKVYDIFDTLADTGDDFQKAVDKLTAHFAPKKNVDFETYRFRQASQSSGENIDQFVTRLRQLAIHCDFSDLDREIKTQIIQSCSSTRLRRRALRENEISLDELIKYGRALEASEQQAKAIEVGTSGNKFEEKRVNSLQSQRNKKRAKTNQPGKSRDRVARSSEKQICRNCGGIWPHREDKPCIAKGKTCFGCGKQNHLQKMCRSKQNKPKSANINATEIEGRSDSGPGPSKFDSSSSDEYTYSVSVNRNNTPEVELIVNGVPITVLLDSGASVNILAKHHYDKMAKQEPQPLHATNIRIYPYGSDTPIPLLGMLDSVVEIESKVSHVPFYVVDGNHKSLLCFTTASELGLIRINSPVNTVTTANGTAIDYDKLTEEFSDIFQGIGKLKDASVHIHVDETVTPVAQPHRRIPFNIRKQVEEELQKLEELGIIEDTEGPTPWVSPLVCVPKPRNPDEVRCCIDMRLVNTAVKRERHLTPTIEEVIHDLNGACHFSKLDLRQGYLQIPLAPESRNLTTFSTHLGIKRYTRMVFGLTSAPEIFQHEIETALQGIPGVKNISDDLIVFGKSQQEHDETLHAVFQRLREKGLTLNKSKCAFNKPNLDFFGFTFSAAGVSPDPKKVTAIKNAEIPKSASEVRSFLGLTNYVSRFIANYATITEPLRQLTRSNTPFVWTTEAQQAFNELQAAITSDTVMAYYDPTAETELIVDASPVGVAAVLTQKSRNDSGSEDTCIIAYASRALTDVEKRYSQTEKEGLALVWGCERFHLYLYGSTFNLITDHKALEIIFRNPRSKPPARIERWQLRLQQYDFTVTYRPGEGNPADYLSRHPVTNLPYKRSVAEEYVNYIATNAVPKAMSLEEIKSVTEVDPTLQAVKACLQSGKWHTAKELFPTANCDDLKSFEKLKSELTETSSGLLLRGTRIVIPQELRPRAVKLAHEGHQGIVKTKKLLREKVWFPGIDNLVEKQITGCLPCQAVGPPNKPPPLRMSTMPTHPWQVVNIDFLGPLPTGEMLLVVIDQHSRFPEVEILTSTTATAVIPKLDRIFATHGIPTTVISDNGPPFDSAEIAKFMEVNGIHHRHITPYWPQANSEAESFMKPLLKAIQTAHAEGRNWRKELQKFLLNFRATPHLATSVSPAELLYNRKIRVKLPSSTDTQDVTVLRSTALQCDAKRKEKMKEYTDKRRGAKPSAVKVGDTVLVKQQKLNKLSTKFGVDPYIVTKVKGTMITAEKNGHSVTRNISFFKQVPVVPPVNQTEHDDDSDDELVPDQNTRLPVAQANRPVRARNQPIRFRDYVM